MTYEIESKNDMLSGAELIVKIPKQDLDKKALYTIEEDKPDFILPFHHRIVDGQIELKYQIGPHSKLQYLAGDRNQKEYAQLWTSILNPLLDCGDWFLKPYSFVLDTKYLYCDKTKNSVSYVYIPSIRDCSDYHELKEMAADFSRLITVTDAELENKVLRTIMMDFHPKTFLQMLKTYTSTGAPALCIGPAEPRYVYEPKALPMPIQDAAKQNDIAMHEMNAPGQPEDISDISGEIVIEIPSDWKSAKKSKKEKGVETNKSKKEKRTKTRGSIGSLLRKQKNTEHAIIIGSDNTRQTKATTASESKPELDARPAVPPVYAPPTGATDITQSISYETSGAWLRLVGSASLPTAIDVVIEQNEIFTIGRYDTASGRQQSSFEFCRTTKAISRRHAAIERSADGYSLIDLSSNAGTFFDGQKLPPNTPCKLQSGCRVSFGNCGADYIWEQ